jgi:hypothetical protein
MCQFNYGNYLSITAKMSGLLNYVGILVSSENTVIFKLCQKFNQMYRTSDPDLDPDPATFVINLQAKTPTKN